MQAAVKLINPSTSVDDCQRRWTKLAICLRGHKRVTCVVNDDSGIHLVRIAVEDYDRFAQSRPESPASVAKRLISFTQRDVAPKPITQGALDVLTQVISGEIPEAEEVEAAPEAASPPAKNNGDARPGILQAICAELKIEPAAARRRLRKAGLSAPYSDETAIRKALS